jgi:hypothetical protein
MVLTSQQRELQSSNRLSHPSGGRPIGTLKSLSYPWRPFRFSIPLVAGSIILVAFVVHMLGWIFEIDFIRRPFAGLISVYPWTTFMLAPLALILIQLNGWRIRPAQGRLLGCALAAITGLLAAAFLFEDFLSADPTWFDRLLFPQQLSFLGGYTPGRPSPPLCVTALVFAIGSLLFLDRQPGKRALVPYASILLGCFFPSLALIGLLTKLLMPTLNTTRPSMGMSLCSAIYFLLLGVGFLSLRRRAGIFLIFRSGALSGRVVRHLLLVALAGPILLGSIIFYWAARGHWNENLGLGLVLLLTITSAIAILTTGALVERHQRVQKRLLNRLLASSAKVERLRRGAVRVCAWTRRIQDENGNWIELEHFLEEQLGLSVSHGMSTEAFDAVNQSIDQQAGSSQTVTPAHETVA